MLGTVLIIVALVVVFPVVVMMTGPIVAASLGWTLKEDAEARNEGSELIALNR